MRESFSYDITQINAIYDLEVSSTKLIKDLSLLNVEQKNNGWIVKSFELWIV